MIDSTFELIIELGDKGDFQLETMNRNEDGGASDWCVTFSSQQVKQPGYEDIKLISQKPSLKEAIRDVYRMVSRLGI